MTAGFGPRRGDHRLRGLVSGITKLASDFIPTFGSKLPEVSRNAPSWFVSALNTVVAPAPHILGSICHARRNASRYRTDRFRSPSCLTLPSITPFRPLPFFALSGLAALSATVLAVTLHIMNGATHPWLLPRDPFDEGVDLDSLLPAIQTVIFIVSLVQLRWLRRPNRTQ